MNRGWIWRAAILAGALVCGTGARAGSAEDGYFAARDRATEALSKVDPAKAQEVERAALAALEKRLIAIVGPARVKGFEATPHISLVGLAPAAALDGLDGLRYQGDDQSLLIVSTRTLTKGWIGELGAAASANGLTPSIPLEDALRMDAFHSLVMGASDGVFVHALVFDAAKPAGVDFALAELARSAAIDGSPFDIVAAAVVKGDRVLLAYSEAVETLKDMPACEPAWRVADLDIQGLLNGNAPAAVADALRLKSLRDWLDCAGAAVKAAPLFPRLSRQAQDLVDRLAGG